MLKQDLCSHWRMLLNLDQIFTLACNELLPPKKACYIFIEKDRGTILTEGLLDYIRDGLSTNIY